DLVEDSDVVLSPAADSYYRNPNHLSTSLLAVHHRAARFTLSGGRALPTGGRPPPPSSSSSTGWQSPCHPSSTRSRGYASGSRGSPTPSSGWARLHCQRQRRSP